MLYVGFILDKIDESLNISGLSRPKGLPKTTNHFDDVDLSTPHAKPSADAETAKSNKLFKDTNKYADDITTNGGTHKYDLETNPVRNYDINTTKNYVANTSQVDIDFQKPKSYQNRLVTDAVGYADDLTVPKTNSSTGDNFFFADNSKISDTNKPIYKPSPKHDPVSGWGSPNPISDIETGQKLLDTAYSSYKNKQLYNIYDGKLIKFQPDTVDGWHSYVVENPAKEVPIDVLRKMMDDGKITKVQYKNFIKNNRR